MIEPRACRERLNALLHAEYACAGQLVTLLETETAALQGRDIDALETLAADKQALMQHFESLEAQRQALLEQAGFGGSPADVEGCIAWCDGSGQLARGWHLLLERIRRSQHQNRCNGAILEASRRHAQQALAVLRGQAPHGDLYHANGCTTTDNTRGRSIAKA
ncbi:MAG: flagella synthesis protein FlgN [Gammaproteobacteria bacterium]